MKLFVSSFFPIGTDTGGTGMVNVKVPSVTPQRDFVEAAGRPLSQLPLVQQRELISNAGNPPQDGFGVADAAKIRL
jgi:hypothetical protein